MVSRRWPWPGDSPITRARKVAHAYRAALAELAPERCAELDKRITQWGQSWAVPQVQAHEPDAWLTPEEAADLASVEVDTISKWRRRGRLAGQHVGPRVWRYRARDVLAMSAHKRQRGTA